MRQKLGKALPQYRRTGMHACRDAKEVADSADLVILAVKPYMIQEVTAPIREELKDKIVVSVAAGYPFEKLEQALLPGTHHLSTCPNTPVAVAEGIIVCEDKHSLTGEEFQMVKDLFEKLRWLRRSTLPIFPWRVPYAAVRPLTRQCLSKHWEMPVSNTD